MYKLSWPNRVTMTRILLVGPFVVALLHLQDARWAELARWSAVLVFVLMAVSDGLDGYLARRLKAESALGRFLDPLADKLVILCSVILLARPETGVAGMLLPSTVAVIAVGKDLVIVVGFCLIYIITSKVYIEARPLGKGCTGTQLLMVILILLSPNLPGPLQYMPAVLWWAASVLAAAAVVQYFRMGLHFVSRHEGEGQRRQETV
jgi:CDP-diacylglycerol--glycerol-3-phosphate 3-phosphatidyltransferase